MKLTAFVLINLFGFSILAADTVSLERTIQIHGSEYSLPSTSTCSIDTDSIDISLTSGDLGATTSTSKFNSFTDLGKVEKLISDSLLNPTSEIQLNPSHVSKSYVANFNGGSVVLLNIDGEKGLATKNPSESAIKLRQNMDLLCN